MSEKIDHDLLVLARWIIGGLVFTFVLAMVLLYNGI